MTHEIAASPRYFTLRGERTLIVLDAARGGRARIVYAGPDLGEVDPAELDQLAQRQHAPGRPETPIAASLLNAIGTGHPSPPGLLGHAGGQCWALDPRVEEVEIEGDHRCIILTRDTSTGLTIQHKIDLDGPDGTAAFSATITNQGDKPFDLEWLSPICLPLDAQMTRVTSFGGKWAGELQTETHDLARGAFLRENRAGRSSHASFPGLYFGSQSTSESAGPAMACHLGWSGNHRLRVDRLADDTISLQAGELLLPGEMSLYPGESYVTPHFYVCWSDRGYGDVTRRLHRLTRPDTFRPVHFNTWEAVYFDHSPEKLMALADQAAEVGAERFVLDDGWFGARRSDRAGLGDWFVSTDVYPDGLKPLADHVRSLGMEFGLWFEPEMVNPDSDLYRAHPDWVLQAEGAEPIPSRHQLPLDLTRSEVCDYLFERIDSLVSELGVAYIKWDMNRDIQHPGGADGKPAMHRQVRALYALIDRIRAAHPDLVIESCSSGGARADYGILARTDRVWTSDNNDARARHAIMRGAAHFLPLELLGNHVGPHRCHITGRRFDMAFRAGTAVFGHMGMELDLAEESEADRAILAAAIALHKRHRRLIHTGDYHRLETPPHLSIIGCVSQDQDEALFGYTKLDNGHETQPQRIHFSGLDPARRYRVRMVWPLHNPSITAPSIIDAADLRGDGYVFAGAALMDHGMQPPLMHPDNSIIYHLEACE